MVKMTKSQIAKFKADTGANINIDPAFSEGDNPNYRPEHHGKNGNPKKSAVVINMMESPAALWYHKNKIIDECQLLAANEFRKIWEGAGGAGAGGMDYSAVVVDTSKVPDSISDYRMDCGLMLKQAQTHIGFQRYHLLRDTCGNGQHIRELYQTRRERDAAMVLVKEGLRMLAELWGFTTHDRNHPY